MSAMTLEQQTARRRLLATIHANAKKLFRDDDYRVFLRGQIGMESCKTATTGQLRRVQAALFALLTTNDTAERDFYRQYRTTIGEPGRAMMPSYLQWRRLATAAAHKGMALDSPALLYFIKRTAKVDSLVFLTARGAQQVIAGLERWHKQTGMESENATTRAD